MSTLGGMLLNQAPLNASLQGANALSGSISCFATTAATPTNAMALSGSSTSSALTTASVDLAARLAGSSTASALLAASATSVVALSGNTFAALPSTPELGGMLLNQAPVNDSLNATAGGIICTATTSGSLGFAHKLSGDLAASSAAQAAPTLLLALSGSLVSTLLMSGSPSQSLLLTGNTLGSAAGAASLGKSFALAGSAASTLLIQSSINLSLQLAGSYAVSVAVGASNPSLYLALNGSVVAVVSIADANVLRETVAFMAATVDGPVLLIEIASLDMLASASQDEFFALAELVTPSGGLYAEAA